MLEWAVDRGLGLEMGVVGYRCPTSGENVTTAIQTSKDTLARMRALELSIWVWCPHCLAGHKINPGDARVSGESVEHGIETIFEKPSFAVG